MCPEHVVPAGDVGEEVEGPQVGRVWVWSLYFRQEETTSNPGPDPGLPTQLPFGFKQIILYPSFLFCGVEQWSNIAVLKRSLLFLSSPDLEQPGTRGSVK